MVLKSWIRWRVNTRIHWKSTLQILWTQYYYSYTNTIQKYTTPKIRKRTSIHKPSRYNRYVGQKGTRYVQAIVGSILYYSKAIEHPMLLALNKISREQATSTSNISIKLDNLLHYTSKFINTVLHIKASRMVVHVNSDVPYLALPNTKSRMAG